MKKVQIDDKRRRKNEYRNKLSSVSRSLEGTVDDLCQSCINLTIRDKWENKNIDIKSGKVIPFAEDMLNLTLLIK